MIKLLMIYVILKLDSNFKLLSSINYLIITGQILCYYSQMLCEEMKAKTDFISHQLRVYKATNLGDYLKAQACMDKSAKLALCFMSWRVLNN